MDIFARLLGRPVRYADFERCVFSDAARHVAEPRAVRRELEAAASLPAVARSPERRENMAAHLYLSFEDHIANRQASRRIPEGELRRRVYAHCDAARAEGLFPLLFLPSRVRAVRLYELFAELLLSRSRGHLGDIAHRNMLDAIAAGGKLGSALAEGRFRWSAWEKDIGELPSANRMPAAEEGLRSAIAMLSARLAAAVDTIRTELFFREHYREFRKRVDFLDDASVVLRIVPAEYLADERLELMAKEDLERELKRKSEALEMVSTRLAEEEQRLASLSREELESKVLERTAELRAALEEVKARRRELEEFSSLAAHELRATVSIIKGYASLLLNDAAGKLDPKQRQFLERMGEANVRQLELINAMLTASRIELGTLAIEPESVYLPDVADRSLEGLAPEISEKGLVVEKLYDRRIPLVDLDPRLMRAVLTNVLSNAVKYSPRGGRILFRIEKKAPDILIAVTDEGCGIPPDEQPKIFSKMFRATNARAQGIEGTGLGLYIVKSVLDQAGGTIRFESPVSRGLRAGGARGAEGEGTPARPGTAFYVTVPLAGMMRREGVRGLS